MRCGGGQKELRENALYRLQRWPDLGQLPHQRHHLQWCGLLARKPTTLDALAEAARTTRPEAAAFVQGCAELGLLERVAEPPQATASSAAAAAATAAGRSDRNRERASIFRSILNRLGIGRPT
jgi:hypothetical protein